MAGTKIDLREDKEVIGQLSAQSLSPIKRDHGIKMASKIRAIKYLECSALTQRGLKQVRETDSKFPKRICCTYKFILRTCYCIL